MEKRMLRIGGWRQIALAMLVLAAASQPGFAQGRVIVFGDSLSDNGNLSMILPGLNPSIPGYYFTVLPSPPAPQSLAFRRSNGPVWVEQLFGTFNSPLQGTGVSGNVDLAIAGARTDATIGPPGPTPPGIAQQIGIFVGSGGGIAASDLVIN
jgi:outer membrane lipase/esterase